MENPQHAFIEKYLDGTLNPGERSKFEAELATDPALAQELRVHEAAAAAIEIQALLDRRERIHHRGTQKLFWKKWQWKIQDALESIFIQRSDESAGRVRWGLVGGLSLATAALLLYLVNPGLFFPETNSNALPMSVAKEQAAEVYEAHFKRIDLRNTLGGADADNPFQTAQNLYTAGSCTAALEALEPLLADENFDRRPLALLLKGTCQLDLGDAEAALKTLQLVPPAAARLFQDAQWYSALAYLKLERVDEANSLLQKIAGESKHRHFEDAAKILSSGK